MKVCEEQCSQCLFTAMRIVSKKRMAEIIKECRKNDTHFICHKHSVNGDDVMCRGFYETQPPSQLLRIAERLNMVIFVKPPNAKLSRAGSAPNETANVNSVGLK